MAERNLRKTRVGLVSSDKMDKTITVSVEEHVKHPLYGKIMKRTYKLKAHDEENVCEVGDKVRGLDCGADDYMTKPFSTDELLARVRALTRRKGDVKEDTVTFGDLILNKNTCELQKVGGEAIKLSLKELQIIDLLFENPKQIIKKERIIEKIWGGDSDAEYNNVEVYISFIRKKLEAIKVKTTIRTSRGIGYSLDEG